tara:strand:+ start:31973 stop:32365 length:393 start_codon:yes stop_codon:yes gene_type:complete
MTWLAVKTFLKKAWVWIKNYWYVPALLVYTVVLWLIFRKRNDKLLQMFEISKESYQKEIEAINAAHADEVQKKNKLVQNYHDTLKNLQKEYNLKLDELSREEEEELLDLIKKHENSPEDLAEEMKRLFGI